MTRMIRKTLTGAVLLAVAGGASAQTAILQPGETLLEVQAEGTATYRPDAAFVTAGVVSTGATASEATEANARTMTAVIAAITRAGVDERYIRTQQINVQPRFARNGPQDYEGQPQITGYVARNSVAITVTTLAKAPAVIGAAFGAGANSVNGPDLGNLDPHVGEAAARASAIANARAEAAAYAQGFGLKIGRVLRVSERGNRATQVSAVRYRVSESMAAPAPPPPPPPPVAGGEMERSVTVWVDYALIAQ